MSAGHNNKALQPFEISSGDLHLCSKDDRRELQVDVVSYAKPKTAYGPCVRVGDEVTALK
jgi:hypothetical protein